MWTALKASRALKIVAVGAVAMLGYGANDWLRSPSGASPINLPFLSSSPSGPSSIGTATVEREFQVQSGYTTQSGKMLLNDRSDYKDPLSTTVVVDTKRLTTAGTDGRALVGRLIKVKGRTTTYNGRAQIVADEISVK